MLAAIGGHYHWSRAELEALTAADAIFYHNAAAELSRKAQEAD